ncbi:hypothetical protein PVL29_019419 [Vitis rotundifolia]|uniref:Uncharacterized protein n=1 Tax=Vitis rotundifolia TaxID=103349 RepID=A0AA39DDK2_VITRO|nr:hypothetical protein PVL29_019419 [Vitis rotundifolia]
MAVNDIKRYVRAYKSFFGNCFSKSVWPCLGLSMDRNAMTKVTENDRAIRDAIAKTIKTGCRSRFGLLLPSFMPHGTVAIEAKATVVTTVATTEHELEVLISHSPPFSTKTSCDFLKTSLGVMFSLLRLIKKSRGTEYFTYCGQFQLMPFNLTV